MSAKAPQVARLSPVDHRQQGLDHFLESMQIRIDAFGTCELGRLFSLRCSPSPSVIVHFVLRGEGYLECSHGRFALRPGTIVIVPKRLPKSLCGAGPIEHVRNAHPYCGGADDLVTFSAHDGEIDLVLGCAELSSTIAGDVPLFDQAKRPIVETSDQPLLKILIPAMFDELRSPRLGTRAFISALMKQVLIVVLRSQPNDESSTLLMSGVRLAGAVAAILDEPGDNHTVESLASIAGMSRSRFYEHFFQAYNCTPRAFVKTARLASAARLLKSSELPVKAIAAAVGYASQSHFSRAFQEKFGADPSAFRLLPVQQTN